MLSKNIPFTNVTNYLVYIVIIEKNFVHFSVLKSDYNCSSAVSLKISLKISYMNRCCSHERWCKAFFGFGSQIFAFQFRYKFIFRSSQSSHRHFQLPLEVVKQTGGINIFYPLFRVRLLWGISRSVAFLLNRYLTGVKISLCKEYRFKWKTFFNCARSKSNRIMIMNHELIKLFKWCAVVV